MEFTYGVPRTARYYTWLNKAFYLPVSDELVGLLSPSNRLQNVGLAGVTVIVLVGVDTPSLLHY